MRESELRKTLRHDLFGQPAVSGRIFDGGIRNRLLPGCNEFGEVISLIGVRGFEPPASSSQS